MVKLKLQQLNAALQALTVIGLQPIRGNAKLGYNLSKIIKCLKAEIEIAREQEAAIFRSFNAKEENGQLFFDEGQLDSTQEKEFNQQIKDLHAIEIEVWGSQITLAEIDAAGLSLSPVQFEQLDWLIADPAGENTQETAKAAMA